MMSTKITAVSLVLSLLLASTNASTTRINNSNNDNNDNHNNNIDINDIDNPWEDKNTTPLIKRWLEDPNADDAIAGWACIANYGDQDGCTKLNDGCVWCRTVGSKGWCLPEQLEGVGNHFPHLECSSTGDFTAQDKTEEEYKADSQFWDEQVSCTMAGGNQGECLGHDICSWCVVDEPSFGICLSSSFVSTVSDAQPDSDSIRLNQIVHCHNEPDEKAGDIDAITDWSCILSGIANNEDVESCEKAADTLGNACVMVGSGLTGEICMTKTQSEFYEWFVHMLQDISIPSPTSDVIRKVILGKEETTAVTPDQVGNDEGDVVEEIENAADETEASAEEETEESAEEAEKTEEGEVDEQSAEEERESDEAEETEEGEESEVEEESEEEEVDEVGEEVDEEGEEEDETESEEVEDADEEEEDTSDEDGRRQI